MESLQSLAGPYQNHSYGRLGESAHRNGPRELDSVVSEIFLGFQAAKSR